MINLNRHAYKLEKQNEPYVRALIIHSLGAVPCPVGSEMLIDAQGQITGTIGGGRLEYQVIQDALSCLQENKSQVYSYPLSVKFGQCCGGKVDIFMQVVKKKALLQICGAGHIGLTLAEMICGSRFHVRLIDSRPHWFESINLSDEIESINCDDDQIVDHLEWNSENSYLVIMTHQHDLDLNILEYAFNKPLKYLGMIGSRQKRQRFMERMQAKQLIDSELNHLHCPIGMNIDSVTVKEIAISIAAELLAVQARKQ